MAVSYPACEFHLFRYAAAADPKTIDQERAEKASVYEHLEEGEEIGGVCLFVIRMWSSVDELPEAELHMEEITGIENSRSQRVLFAVLAVALFASFASQLIYHAVQSSATVDEPFHILAGHRQWQCGDFGINPEHPPLLKFLATAPLNFRNLSEPPWECGSKLTPKFDGFSYGSTFVVENGIDDVVITTRLAASLMSILLALLVFLAAWEMFGRWQALTALAIVAFEPNFIAHGSIVTTDMALSTTAFAAVYALYRFVKIRSWPRFFIAALAIGLMLAAKHSAVIFVGISFVLLIADTILFQRGGIRLPKRLLRQVATFAAMFLIGMTILWSFYGFRYRAIPNETAATISVADFIKENGRPESVQSFPARVTEMLSHAHIFPESYILGMADVIAWGSRNCWLFGRTYPTGKWFYFPVAFVVKSNIALLFLLPIGLIFLYFARDKWREGMFLLVPPVVFFAFASSSNFNTGVRHILPIYGFLIVIASAGAVWLCCKLSAFRYVLIALLVLNAAATMRTAPSYLAFANDLWGGLDQTHLIFADSNVETGQSMKLVSEYIAGEGLNDCWISTFVHPEMIRAVQPCRPMLSNLRIMISRDLIDPLPPVIEGTVVLSVIESPPRGGDEYLPIVRSQPIAFLGGNTFVYRGRFDVPLVAAQSRVHRCNHFLRIGRVEEALVEGRMAVELGPDDSRTHLALGMALARSGQKEEARRELLKTAELAAADARFRNQEVWARRELALLNDSGTP